MLGGALTVYLVRIFAILVVLATLGTRSTPATAQSERPRVVATFSVIGDLVWNVAGNTIQLTTLVGPDGDTERYEPTAADARSIAQASMILENGLGSEPWLDRFYTASRSSAPRVRVSQGIELLREGNQVDPHFWHDVGSTIRVVRTIRDALAGIDPANTEIYSANAERYIARLEELDQWVLNQVATVPPERRKLVTSHDTFGYFAHRYGFEIVGAGLPSLTTEAQPSAQRVRQLVQDIRRTGVPAVFTENVMDPRLMEQVAREAGVVLAPALHTDALGSSQSSGGSYVGMVTHNVSTIVAALR
jgi:ABC-type Zn uptake system ZnuABC Zn-binding protein ZnuA